MNIATRAAALRQRFLQGLADTMRFRLAVDRGNDVCARNSYDDTGTVANAIDVIDRYAAKHAKVTVLLGENRSY
jgi:signal transduction protein with GAF and PtsI domain